MSISQINDYGVGDTNFTSFMETLDATRRGLAQITISEYDTDSAPSVKVGAVFEVGGAFYQVSGTDETPTGYSGISNSTTFYLYFDVSAEAFIYSSSAPTWSDALQGWYNGDDRAFFSMYKDSGGTLYIGKKKFEHEQENSVIHTYSGGSTANVVEGLWYRGPGMYTVLLSNLVQNTFYYDNAFMDNPSNVQYNVLFFNPSAVIAVVIQNYSFTTGSLQSLRDGSTSGAQNITDVWYHK
jgi:hypothetical protein